MIIAILGPLLGLTPMLGYATPETGVDLTAMEGWQIVIGPDAIASERYAAQEFRDHFIEATGVALPVVTETNRSDRQVFIGPSAAMRASPAGFNIDLMGDEDLRIVIGDHLIAIAGGRPRGTLYGVYSFLEDYPSIRFLTRDHTHVPKIGPWRRIGPVDRSYHPPLSFRWPCYGETSE